jgi:hypothetical protein
MNDPTLLPLPRVALVCVDCTPQLPWALAAMRECLARARFADAVICTDRASLGDLSLPPGVRLAEIEPLRSAAAYSAFMLKSLLDHVSADYVLVVQWDGYLLHPSAWRPEFLDYDYVGAPWTHIPEPHAVGNGGFSLRSRRLLEALQDPTLAVEHPEDVCICVTHRAVLEDRGLRFAPTALAGRFAVEDGELGPAIFGFHAAYHLPSLLEPRVTRELIASLAPDAVWSHAFRRLLYNVVALAAVDARMRPVLLAVDALVDAALDRLDARDSGTPQALGLCKALIRCGRYAAARRLLSLRRHALGTREDHRLWLRLHANRLIEPLRRRPPPPLAPLEETPGRPNFP